MKNLFYLPLLFLMIFFYSCEKEKDPIVDPAGNELEDVNSLASFEMKISEGVSFVFFHASWCSTCAAQRPVVEVLPDNTDFSDVFFGEVEFEDNQDIDEAYSVFSFPTIVVFKDGDEIMRYTGSGHSEADLSQTIYDAL